MDTERGRGDKGSVVIVLHMSFSSTGISAAHFDYLTKRTRGEDRFLAELRAAAREAGLPPISIGPAQASFLQILLKAGNARDVVEVGTLGGYSAISMEFYDINVSVTIC